MSTEAQQRAARENGKKGGGSDRLIDLNGKTFGDWTVLHFSRRGTDRHCMWSCRCVCGVVRDVSGGNLRGGGSLSCGCTKKGKRLRPYEALFNSIAASAKHPVELTYEEFLLFVTREHCQYCDSKVVWSKWNITRNGSNYNLDRKDPSLGYTKENCVVCCARCNRAKSNHFTYEEWLQIGAVIRGWK